MKHGVNTLDTPRGGGGLDGAAPGNPDLSTPSQKYFTKSDLIALKRDVEATYFGSYSEQVEAGWPDRYAGLEALERSARLRRILQ